MTCPVCSCAVFLSDDDPPKQLPCWNCGGTVHPIGISEEEWLKQLAAKGKQDAQANKH